MTPFFETVAIFLFLEINVTLPERLSGRSSWIFLPLVTLIFIFASFRFFFTLTVFFLLFFDGCTVSVFSVLLLSLLIISVFSLFSFFMVSLLFPVLSVSVLFSSVVFVSVGSLPGIVSVLSVSDIVSFPGVVTGVLVFGI